MCRSKTRKEDKVNPQDIISVYENGVFVAEYTGQGLLDESPIWNGELGIGDIVTADGRKMKSGNKCSISKPRRSSY